MLRKTGQPNSGLGVWIALPGALGHTIKHRLCMMEEHEGTSHLMEKNASILSKILTLMNMIDFLWQISIKLKLVCELEWRLNRYHMYRGKPEIEESLVETEQKFAE